MESLQQEINRFELLNKQMTEVINSVKKIEDLKIRKIIRDQLNMIDGKTFYDHLSRLILLRAFVISLIRLPFNSSSFDIIIFNSILI